MAAGKPVYDLDDYDWFPCEVLFLLNIKVAIHFEIKYQAWHVF